MAFPRDLAGCVLDDSVEGAEAEFDAEVTGPQIEAVVGGIDDAILESFAEQGGHDQDDDMNFEGADATDLIGRVLPTDADEFISMEDPTMGEDENSSLQSLDVTPQVKEEPLYDDSEEMDINQWPDEDINEGPNTSNAKLSQTYEEQLRCSCANGQSQLKVSSQWHYHCNLCEYAVYPLYRMRFHEMLKHKYVRPEFADKAIHCPHQGCDVVSPSESLYRKHIKTRHGKPKSSHTKTKRAFTPYIRHTHHQLNFFSKLTFSENITTYYEPMPAACVEVVAHLGQITWGCNACDYICKNRCKMKIHIGAHSHRLRARQWKGKKLGSALPAVIIREGDLWKCLVCDEAFDNKEFVIPHIRLPSHHASLGQPMEKGQHDAVVNDSQSVSHQSVPHQSFSNTSKNSRHASLGRSIMHVRNTHNQHNFFSKMQFSENLIHFYEPMPAPCVEVVAHHGQITWGCNVCDYLCRSRCKMKIHLTCHSHRLRARVWDGKKIGVSLPVAIVGQGDLWKCLVCDEAFNHREFILPHIRLPSHHAALGQQSRHAASGQSSRQASFIQQKPKKVDNQELELCEIQSDEEIPIIEEPHAEFKQTKERDYALQIYSNIVKDANHRSFCKACQVYLVYEDPHDLIVHRQGEVHKKNLRKNKPIQSIIPFSKKSLLFFCQDCNIQLMLRWSLELKAHVRTGKHLRNATCHRQTERTFADIDKEDVFPGISVYFKSANLKRYCEICGLHMIYKQPKDFDIHLNTAHHTRNVMKKEAGEVIQDTGTVYLFHCKVCDRQLIARHTGAIRSHLTCADHVERKRPKAGYCKFSDQDYYHCTSCQLLIPVSCVPSELEVKRHMGSIRHRTRVIMNAEGIPQPRVQEEPVEKMEPVESMGSSEGWYCKLCDVYVAHKTSKFNHLHSVRHKERERMGEYRHSPQIPPSIPIPQSQPTPPPDYAMQPGSPGWHCSVCNVAITSRKNKWKHLKSFAHLQKVERSKEVIEEATEVLSISEESDHDTGKWYCELCDVTVWNKQEHCRSVKHTQKESLNKMLVNSPEAQTVDEKSNMWFCSACNVSICNRQKTNHILGFRHKLRVQQRAKARKEDVAPEPELAELKYCQKCDFVTRSMSYWKKHLRSSLHLERVPEDVAKAEEMKPAPVSTPDAAPPSTSTASVDDDNSQGGWHCKICNKTLVSRSEYERIRHLRSSTHQTRVLEMKNQREGKNITRMDYRRIYERIGESCVCKLCNLVFEGKQAWKNHTQTLMHRHALLKWKKAISNAESSAAQFSEQLDVYSEPMPQEQIPLIKKEPLDEYEEHASPKTEVPFIAQQPDSKTCRACNFSTMIPALWERHLSSTEHRLTTMQSDHQPKLKSPQSSFAVQKASGEMECLVCGITAKNPISWHNHINADWHLENVMKQQAPQEEVKHLCKICNESFHLKSDLLFHYRSKEHRLNASSIRSIIVPPDYLHSSGDFIVVDKDFYNCQLCDVTTRNQITWKYHLQTQRHLQKVAEYYGRKRTSEDPWDHQEPYLVLPQSPTERFTCKLCNYTTGNECTWTFHLKTIRHKEQVEKLRVSSGPSVSCPAVTCPGPSAEASTINININLGQRCKASGLKPARKSSESASSSRPKRKSAEDAENRIKDLSFLDTMSTNKIMKMVETKQHLEQMEDTTFDVQEKPAIVQLPASPKSQFINLEEDDEQVFQPEIISTPTSSDWPTEDVKPEWSTDRMPDDVAALLDSYHTNDSSSDCDEDIGPITSSEPEFIVLEGENE